MTTKTHLYLAFTLCLSAITSADTAIDPDLKSIMQDLRNDSVQIMDGLLVDDFESVAAAAVRIAEHPQIPASQVALVAAELGKEMPSFKQLDTLVHDLAVSIQSAANDKDGGRATADYQQMLDGCLTCHAAYRQRVALVLQPVNVE